MNEYKFPNSKVVLATCNLNLWALDFEWNLKQIIRSIEIAKKQGAKFRLGPELELSGYSCEDHFFELDTFLHSEESLATILTSGVTNDILCDIGCPMMHNNVRYNCRIFCLNGKILLVRPKVYLADDGNYRERRFFTSWKPSNGLQTYVLSDLLQKATGQCTVDIGVAAIATRETKIAAEICEELWTPEAMHIQAYLSGVEIISNASGSHHQLRKLDTRLSLIRNATGKCGGVYLYSNHRGCDGTRLYFDGCSTISLNGELLVQASQFSMIDVEVVTAIVDLNDVRSYRNSCNSLQEQTSSAFQLPVIDARYFSLVSSEQNAIFQHVTQPIVARIHTPEEECALGPACWLWDYMRRSGATGFLLPLSGGADSAAVATIVYTMCRMAVIEAEKGTDGVQSEIERIIQKPSIQASTVMMTENSQNGKASKKMAVASKVTAEDLCHCVLHSVYMGTINSSVATRSRAENLSKSFGAYHTTLFFDGLVKAVHEIVSTITGGHQMRYESQGGSTTEDLALQNIQSRLRMVIAYLCAAILPWFRSRKGYLLVLGSANVAESLRGYMTKYDCSSADLNPIGGISKGDLKRMLSWAALQYSVPALDQIVNAVPTAELRPIEAETNQDYTQTDEADMGVSYEELGVFGTLRKIHRCGPVTMFLKLLSMWTSITPAEVAAKVKHFFYFYSINRHKMTTLTPSYHAENYGTDDNRFDLRQFLYNPKWPRQFASIDELVRRWTTTKSK